MGTDGVINGDSHVVSRVSIDGGAGNDILIGSAGDDFLNGGLGADAIDGSAGQDVLVSVANKDQTLTLTQLVVGSDSETQVIDTHQNIETADLTGGTDSNTLDASQFTKGGVTLRTGGGTDSLVGTSHGDSFFVDVNNLVENEQVSIDSRGGEDHVTITGFGTELTSNHFSLINWLGDKTETTFGDESTAYINVNDITSFGEDVNVRANVIDVIDATIDSSGVIAGDINLLGHHITLDNAQLIAKSSATNPGFEADGDINIIAKDGKKQLRG